MSRSVSTGPLTSAGSIAAAAAAGGALPAGTRSLLAGLPATPLSPHAPPPPGSYLIVRPAAAPTAIGRRGRTRPRPGCRAPHVWARHTRGAAAGVRAPANRTARCGSVNGRSARASISGPEAAKSSQKVQIAAREASGGHLTEPPIHSLGRYGEVSGLCTGRATSGGTGAGRPGGFRDQVM